MEHNKLRKTLKEMWIRDHLIHLLRNLYSGQEATVRTGHGATDWFKIGKGVQQGCVLSHCLFNFYAEYVMWNTGLDESQAGINTARRNINKLRYADYTTLMAESVVLEKTLESPLDYKEIQPVHSEGDQLWVFFGRNDAKAETPVLWPPHAKNWLIGKDSDAGRDWGQEEKGTIEDEMSGWHHRLDGREFEWTPGDGDRQGGLASCSSWGRKELDITEQLNWTELNGRK